MILKRLTIGKASCFALASLLCCANLCLAQESMSDSQIKTTVQLPAETIDVTFITQRNRTGSTEPADYFDGSRGELTAGSATVSFSPIWGVSDISSSFNFYIPDEKIALVDIREKSLPSLYDGIKSFSRQGNGNHVLYVHGYNIDFEKSCRRTALFQRALGLKDRLLLFSWPADGNMLKYTWDEADLTWSVAHIAGFFEKLETLTGREKVDVVAHSLGARGVVNALVRLSYRKRAGQIINELILIAPDIDAGVFAQELAQLRGVVRRITVYVSDNDKALRLSQEVHGYPRLGQAGENLQVFDGVESIDISRIATWRMSGHLYHLFNPEVIADLTELLHTGKPAQQRPRLKKMVHDGLPYWEMQPQDAD